MSFYPPGFMSLEDGLDPAPEPELEVYTDDAPEYTPEPPAPPAKAQRVLLAAFGRKIADELNRRLGEPHKDRDGWRWSDEQEAIFQWFSGNPERRNLVVRARGGTGKTTTIMEGVRRIAGAEIEAETLHTVGYRIVRKYWESCRIDKRRIWALTDAVAGDQTPDPIKRLVGKLAELAMQVQPFAERGKDLVDLAWDFDLSPDEDWEEDGYDTQAVASLAVKVMGAALEKPRGAGGKAPGDGISFAEMVYLPVRLGWVRPRYDLVCVDEAQDMNASQILLAQGLSRDRIAVIGDERQAIYGFRGADSGVIDRLLVELQADELGLRTTYRCPQGVVAEAQPYCPDYRAAESNPPGIVRAIAEDKLLAEVGCGDVVLSRVNAPLLSFCLQALKDGKPARVEGKDVAAGLRSLIEKLAKGAARASIPAFLERLSRWRDQEANRILRANLRDTEAKLEQLDDKHQMLAALAQGATGIPDLKARLDTVFAEVAEGRCTTFSSVHKAKGLEWKRVFILRSTLRRESFGKGKARPGAAQEESNIAYVAVTRSMAELVWVD